MPGDIANRAHPRLFGLTAVGAVGIAIGVVVQVVGGGGAASTTWALRISFLGFLLLVFGLAGYLAIGVFERRPEP